MTDSKTPSEAGAGGAASTPVSETPTAAPPPKPRKSGCGCLLPLLGLLATVGLAPQIVMLTSLRNQMPALLLAELPPGVVIGSASAGWISPTQLNDVVIPDDQGRPSLTLKHVTLSRSLWDLAQSTGDLGTIVVEQPVLQVYVDGSTTNYDEFIQRLRTRTRSGRRSLIDLRLTAGEITVYEETRGQEKQVDVERNASRGATSPTNDPSENLPDDADTTPRAPDLIDEPAGVAEPPAEQPRPGRVIAILDLRQATLKSQKPGDEELVGELTALVREPAVEQPLTGEIRWDLPEIPGDGIGSGKLKLSVPSLPLAVLSPWLAPFTSGRELSGEVSLEANAEVVPSEHELLLGAQIQLPHLDVKLGPADAQSPPFRWVGDDLQLIVEGQGDLGGQLLTIESARLRTPLVNADFAGTVRDLPGQAICGLAGTCDLNPADLLAALPPEWASRIHVDGLQLGEIRVEGALRRETDSARPPVPVVNGESPPASASVAAAPLRVNADVRWNSASVMGFQSQKALINVDWSERQLSINPNRLPIGEGRWVASPRVEFTPAGRQLVFDGGPVFENVEFTQEMSDTWLRYVSPILGSATSIQGKFSLSASPARVALAAPRGGEIQGVIDIHSAQAGPGPLTRPLVEVIAGLQTILGRRPGANAQWMQVEKQRVPFHFVEGRVHHQDLQVGFGDVVVHSAGSVGLDETIDFQFSVPLPDKWTAGNPLLANLKNEAISFPMRGTLDRPQLDGRALAEFGKRIGIQGAGGLIQQLFEKGLGKKPNGGTPPTPRPSPQR